jgi:SWI/SNF-related matrix-associated actin-dependent regulator of chromatin subfamily A containing DEAD/H box 1
MSTVRIKRKHVLDSDSDDDDDAPSASVALASVSNGSSEKENAGVGGTPSSPTGDAMPQIKKRLTKKADPSSVPSPVVAPAPDVVVIDDGLGTTDDDDVIVVDAAATTPVGPVAIEDESDEEDDQALMECARISRRLRRALGHDDDAKGKSDGPLSPGGRASSEPRRLVTAQDVAAVAGDGSRANGLKPYQMVGVNFLLLLDEQDVPGAILADEMGLGKTAQTIAYLACSRAGNALPASADVAKEMRRRRNEPALVVAPASLLENWRRELTTWAPALRVGFYHGGPSQDEVRATAEAWAHGIRGDGRSASGGGAFDVIIACYSIFERDSADSREKRAWLRSLNYSHLVLDEAHLVKNRATQRARRLDAVATKARRRVLLTGTPLQNNLGELESLIHLVLPGLLEEGALGTDTYEETDTNELARAHRLQRVKEILRPFILRRLKEEVAKELIPKTQEKRIVAMSESQKAQYDAAVEAARNERRRAREAASSKSDSHPTGASPPPALNNTKVKALFVHLRKIANHPLLVRSRYGDEEIATISDVCHRRGVFGHEATLAKVESHVKSLSDFDLHQLCGEQGHLSNLCLSPAAFSGAAKTSALVDLLATIKAKGSRPLIFSQWKIVLDILEWVLREKGHRFVRLDGSTDVHQRQQICDAYNKPGSEIFCFLLSTRAGGQGLNLTGADTVIIHDCDFNPQIDRQAEDRCHRLGQTRPVTVHRLVTAGTVDERIVQIAERKLDLDAAVLSDTKVMAAEESKAMHSIIEDLLG